MYPIAGLFLFLYSGIFQSRIFLGNLLVAGFCAFIPLLPLLAERNGVILLSQHGDYVGRQSIFLIFAFSLFAFLSTLYREIIKDIEDIEGDRSQHMETTPLVIGVRRAKLLTAFIAGILIVAIVFWMVLVRSEIDSWLMVLAFITLVLPTGFSLLFLVRARGKSQFRQVSQIIKWIMVAGLIFLIIYARFA